MKGLLKYTGTILFRVFITMLFLVSYDMLGQNLKATARLEPQNIKIGEQAKLIITVDYRTEGQELKLTWPKLKDTVIKNIEIVNASPVDTTYPNKDSDPYALSISQTLYITSFDSGYYAIPPFQFFLTGDSNAIGETEALLLHVSSVPVDTSKAIKEIKLPLDTPFHWKELLPYALPTLAILIIIGVIIYIIYRFKKKRPKQIPVVPAIPPHVVVLQQLNELKQEKLWESGHYKKYHITLSDIVRIYLENRFRIPAMEQTTDEIMISLRSADIQNELRSKLKQVLRLADMVKFAKEQPIHTENEMSMQHAIEFVEGTIIHDKLENTGIS